MTKQSLNTFIKGLNVDIDKSVISKDSYLDAHNFRIVTSEGASSGAFENVKGNKLIGENLLVAGGAIVSASEYLVVSEPITYDSVVYHVGDIFTGDAGHPAFTGAGKVLDLTNADMLPKNQLICGAKRLRDYIILFTTTNTSVTPTHGAGRSMIHKLIINKTTEEVTSITLLYDDNLNAGVGVDTLDFSTANKIKAISRYETPNIQKVYFTDGYNNLRYFDAFKYLTITGSVYTANDYMTTSMFEFLPPLIPSKPTLVDIVGGDLMTGMVQYSYQLYRLNGAETAFAPVSDMIHIVTDNDFGSNTNIYHGNGVSVNSGKGCKISIVNGNSGYDRIRLIRIHYSTLNSIPLISVCNELEISTSPTTITITDSGDTISTLTLDEFNISSTELFKCEDIASKDNRLFAANIEKSEFTVSAFDTRAVRFRNWDEPLSDDDTLGPTSAENALSLSFVYSAPNVIDISITNFQTWAEIEFALDPTRTITDVTALSATANISGTYGNNTGTHNIAFSDAASVVSNLVYNHAADTLDFRVTKAAGNYFTNWDHFEIDGDITFSFDYEYDYSINHTDAIVYNDVTPLTIDVPAGDTPAQWNTAHWNNYTSSHDGINVFNDPDNDGDDEFGFKFQSNGTVLGAEGPYIKLDFITDDFILDSSNANTTFFATPPTDTSDLSYKNYASPWKDGKLSWQRDEVYRLFVVFGNDRGQRSEPSWICDLRMPSMHDSGYLDADGNTIYSEVIATIDGTNIKSYRLLPRVYFKSFPTNATWAQICRVKRDRSDRSVVTQGFAVPSKTAGGVYYPDLSTNILPNGGKMFKLVSPEINITKNISYQGNDYIEYIADYHTDAVNHETEVLYGDHHTVKCLANRIVAYADTVKTTIDSAINVSPSSSGTSGLVSILGETYCNYYIAGSDPGKGSTGLLIYYHDATWSAETVENVIVNYKANVYGSQYGGHAYEDRFLNISIPCSGIIISTNADGGILHWNNVDYGDTFINNFDVQTLLSDLSVATLDGTESEAIYVPLESSINCNLRHDTDASHYKQFFGVADYPSLLRQEYAGTFKLSGDPYIFNQLSELYLYNTVYSQQSSAQYVMSSMLDTTTETSFDCLVKASNVKYNGELSDSWTKFNVNEEIEVDSNYGPVRAINTVNDKLLYWQEDAFGMLSVNPRSLIQDASSAQLALGTGGLLDRYDYISSTVGILDKFSIVDTDSSVYWFYDKDHSIYKFDNKLSNLAKEKGVWSWFNTNYSSSFSVHGIYDRTYNEVLFTLYATPTSGYTMAFNEQTDQFTGEYDFVPYMYIDYKDGYLSTKPYSGAHVTSNYSLMFMHNSNINPRCRFYSLLNYADTDTSHTFASTVKLLYNEGYPTTKVFDNIFYISNSFSESSTPALDNIEQYGTTFDRVRCYNDYQNTNWVTLTYGTNLMRRDRGWTLAIPRNLVDHNYITSPDIFTDLAATKEWGERIRDKYMVLDLSFNNTTKTRFVVPFIGVAYRISYR